LSGTAFSELRSKLDGNDNFVTGGHRVMKTAGATRHAARMKMVPVWALDDEKIKQFIFYRFPKAKIDPEQRRLAARTIRIIHLYYRVGLTESAVAGELKMTQTMVHRRLHLIRRAMSRPLKPSHRPKKVVPIDAPNGSSEQSS
jgi:hypothetical protein